MTGGATDAGPHQVPGGRRRATAGVAGAGAMQAVVRAALAHVRVALAAVGVALAAVAVVPVAAQEASSAAAIRAAQEGGTVIVCRHAITDSFREREPVDYDDPSTQRRLDDEGEAQSRRMGAAMRRLGIAVTDLVASPMDRAIRTAQLMFERRPRIDPIWHTNGGSYGGAPLEARRGVLSESPTAGNVLIVSHIGTMGSVLPEVEGELGEGDCIVVRPTGDDHTVVGIVPWRDWERAGRGGG